MQYLWNTTNASEHMSNADVCAVCLEQVKSTNVTITACGHKFCTSCLLKSLQTINTCPMCRAEIEPKRSAISPISISIATEIIREEERVMDIPRRIATIQSFSGTNGRSSMIFSLCREVALATAHAMARWYKTQNNIYHNSWLQFDEYESDDGD